jgi:hypothetical protein
MPAPPTYTACELGEACRHTSVYVSIRQHTSAYVSIRQHPSASVRICQHPSAYTPPVYSADACRGCRQDGDTVGLGCVGELEPSFFFFDSFFLPLRCGCSSAAAAAAAAAPLREDSGHAYSSRMSHASLSASDVRLMVMHCSSSVSVCTFVLLY